MRQEAALSGVDVIAVEPGAMRTGMVTRQQETVRGDLDKLPPDARLRYGGYYRGFEAALRLIAQTGMTPSVVSNVILNILSAESPHTRYVVGHDAEVSLKTRNDMSDRDLDAVYHSLLFKPEVQREQPQKGESDSNIP
jgi:NAD(P)-dependent dehydrogenase (short-subunit alcohol dehydrogenase family)